VRRSGRWIDFQDDYKTLNVEFMETVWWVFGQIAKQDLVYKGMKVRLIGIVALQFSAALLMFGGNKGHHQGGGLPCGHPIVTHKHDLVHKGMKVRLVGIVALQFSAALTICGGN